jgi:hypothetical protein
MNIIANAPLGRGPSETAAQVAVQQDRPCRPAAFGPQRLPISLTK